MVSMVSMASTDMLMHIRHLVVNWYQETGSHQEIADRCQLATQTFAAGQPRFYHVPL